MCGKKSMKYEYNLLNLDPGIKTKIFKFEFKKTSQCHGTCHRAEYSLQSTNFLPFTHPLLHSQFHTLYHTHKHTPILQSRIRQGTSSHTTGPRDRKVNWYFDKYKDKIFQEWWLFPSPTPSYPIYIYIHIGCKESNATLKLAHKLKLWNCSDLFQAYTYTSRSF